MSRLERLTYAIQVQEGFYKSSRSWRNNNPGNLRASPFKKSMDDGFVVFSFYVVGWFALWWDLKMKCKGKTRTNLNGNSTLLELFNVYAPKSNGNNPSAYAEGVATRLGIPTSTQLKWFLEKD